MFEQLFNSPFLYSLSLTLVHFLWQGLLVAFILKLLLFIVDKNKSKLRYTLATLAMLANVILALLTYNMVYPDTTLGFNSNLSTIPLTSLVNELTQKNALFTSQQLLPSILAYLLPYLSLFWLATVTILTFKLLIEIRNVNNLPIHSSVPPSSALSARFNELAKQLKLPSTPKLLISLKAEVPMAIGWLKPVVLLPATMVTGLNAAQLEMLLLHELAHIRRHDYFVNFLQTLIELLFFFHPSVHWIGKQIRNEREYCSDDIAVQHCGDAIAYAHTLADTASLCSKNGSHTIPTIAMAASGGDLKVRVLRLVDHHCAPTNNTTKLLAALSLFLTLALLTINQLLTTPFAQPLNDQFPWREPLSISDNIMSISDTVISMHETSIDKQVTTKSNDVIAQKLLSNLLSNQGNSAEDLLYTEELVAANVLLHKESLASNETLAIVKNHNQLAKHSIASQKILTTRVDEPFTPNNYQKTPNNHQKISNITADKTKEIQLAAAKSKQPVTIVKPKEEQTNLITKVPSKKSEPSILASVFFKPIASKKAKEDLLPPTKVHKLVMAKPQAQVKSTPIQRVKSAVQTASLTPSKKVNQLTNKDALYQSSLTSNVAKKVLSVPSSFEAKLLESIRPVYPNLAKRRGIEMEVTVDFTIDRNGKVKDINFTQQSKLMYFKSAIRSAIRQWRFNPATKNNRKIESKMTKIFSFSLHA